MDIDKHIDILRKITAFFMQNGIKSHNMGDISRVLGISKKTLYSVVSNKRDLVKKVVQLIVEEEKLSCIAIQQYGGNAIDKFYENNRWVSAKLQATQPVVIYDLQTYYPEAWAILVKHREDFVLGEIRKNLEEGISEGLFREMDVRIVSRVIAQSMYSIFEAKLFPSDEYSFSQVHSEIVRYHIRGIANEKGLKYINILMKKTEDELL